MTPFKAGDRVRVRGLPAVGSYAGLAGVVVGVSRAPSGVPAGYHVKLDVDLSGTRADGIGVSFGPAELEPEAGSTP